MSTVILPFLEQPNDPVAAAASRIGPVLLRAPPSSTHTFITQYYLLVDHASPHPALSQLIAWLDNGADKLIVSLSLAKEVIDLLPPERLIVLLDASSVSTISDKIGSGVSGVLLKMGTVDLELVSSIGRFFAGGQIYVLPSMDAPPAPSLVREVRRRNATLVIPSSFLTLSSTSSAQLNMAEAFIAPLVSDRAEIGRAHV